MNELDVFFPKLEGNMGMVYYRAICLYNGVIDEKCPNNVESLCSTLLTERPTHHYHEWDGRNAWKCLCG